MAYGVFIHRADSIYKDSPAEQYQFPRQYLGRVKACIGDWIVYYEPLKVFATKGYFAVARVDKVVPDPTAPGMYLALIESGSYLDFPNPVPFSGSEGVIERGLLNEAGSMSARAQWAVRPISSQDFRRIVDIGLSDHQTLLPRIGEAAAAGGFDEEVVPFVHEERSRVAYLGSRIMRDRIFRQVVLRAYDSRCAITGLKLINGGGRPEVEAAHIKPVEADGPDIVTNGLALTGTAHWMFDRGLVSIADDLSILISRHVNDPESVHAMINSTGRVLTPLRAADRPHPHFLQWHREHCFKQ